MLLLQMNKQASLEKGAELLKRVRSELFQPKTLYDPYNNNIPANFGSSRSVRFLQPFPTEPKPTYSPSTEVKEKSPASSCHSIP
jgi:hypothetical protein